MKNELLLQPFVIVNVGSILSTFLKILKKFQSEMSVVGNTVLGYKKRLKIIEIVFHLH